MSEWMKRLIKKHTCFYCGETVNKADIVKVKLDTGEGPHELTACEQCGKDLNKVLIEIEKVKNDEL